IRIGVPVVPPEPTEQLVPLVTTNGNPLLICPSTVTVTNPVNAPDGTLRISNFEVHEVTVACTTASEASTTPFLYGVNCTVPPPPRFEPEMTIGVPTGP